MPLFQLDEFPALKQKTSVCLGMFDGVHIGHQQLIRETVKGGECGGLLPCAFTFDVPPAAALNPEKHVQLLTDISEKSRLLHAYGLKHVFYTHFDASIANMPAHTFFEEILLGQLQAAHIVVGFHYHFGKHAAGDARLLQELCNKCNISLTIVPPVTLANGLLISSSAIRQALSCGDAALAQKMLGRPVPEQEFHPLGGYEHA